MGQVMYVDEHNVATLGPGPALRFGRVRCRVDRDEAGNPTGLTLIEFPGLAVASDHRPAGWTVFLTPRWTLVVCRYRPHEDGWVVGTVRRFRSLEALRAAPVTAGEAPIPVEVLAEAEERMAALYGESIPNDFERIPAELGASAWRHLDV